MQSEKVGTYYPEPSKAGKLIGTLCFFCSNSVPGSDPNSGCEWSQKFQPVEGWIATPCVLKCGSRPVDTFCVHECPKFVQDSEIFLSKC